jgi:hypothetical protein
MDAVVNTILIIEIEALCFAGLFFYQALRLRRQVERVFEQNGEQITSRASGLVKESRLVLCFVAVAYIVMAVLLHLFSDPSSAELGWLIFGVFLVLFYGGAVLWVFSRGIMSARHTYLTYKLRASS